MYRSAVILIVALVLFMLVLIVGLQGVAVVDMLAVVDERVGAANVLDGSESRPARIGMLVSAGERVRTGAGSRVGLHWADGTRIEVGPQSEFVIQRCRRNTMKHSRQSRFHLNLGQVWIRLRGALDPRSKFEVETPTIVAAVRGTIFGVKVAPDGTTDLQVYRGEVAIVGNGFGQGVNSGSCATVGQHRFDLRPMSGDEQQGWRKVTDITGPLLDVPAPTPGITTVVPLASVQGHTEESAVVSINGERAKVGRHGMFRGRARLVEGPNVITIVATMGDLRTVVRRSITYANPTREIVLTSRPGADRRDPSGTMEITAVLRDNAGELAVEGTPIEIVADRGAIERHLRTERSGAVTVKWLPDGGNLPARVTATSGAASATVVLPPSAPASTPAAAR